ncbi:MAG: MoaD/ThiS family protein [Nitrososphaeria archaeon]
MARIKLRVFYELIDVLGAHETEINAENVEDLLNTILKKYGERAERAIMNNRKEFHEHFLVYVNNAYVKRENYSKLKLNNGDVVMLIPPVGGG